MFFLIFHTVLDKKFIQLHQYPFDCHPAYPEDYCENQYDSENGKNEPILYFLRSKHNGIFKLNNQQILIR